MAVGQNAIRAVARFLPDFRPLSARGDDPGDRGNGHISRSVCEPSRLPPCRPRRSNSRLALGNELRGRLASCSRRGTLSLPGSRARERRKTEKNREYGLWSQSSPNSNAPIP